MGDKIKGKKDKGGSGSNSGILMADGGGNGGGGMAGGGGNAGGMGMGGMGGACGNVGILGSCGLNTQAPATPNRVTPDIEFFRNTFMQGNATINGTNVAIWGFNDGAGGGMGGMGGGGGMGGSFPSPAIRVREGQIVHTHLNAMMMMVPHTIHHHGIEPDAFNDGVGHYSFDVLGNYTYQWRASQAGTYFYHCHVNTVLHAEMGMYGALIVDPPDGPGTASDGTSYNVEAIWAVDDIDTAWHCLPWNAALCGGDAGLNNFNPDLFCITGLGQLELDADATAVTPTVAINANRGDTVLLRYIMAGYVPQRVTFHKDLGDVTIVAEDGRNLPSKVTLKAGSSVFMTAAERYEFIFQADNSGTAIPIDIDYFNYRAVSGSLRNIGSIRGYVNVN